MYLKTIGKSKALVATLSDTKPKDDSDNENDGILNAFTATCRHPILQLAFNQSVDLQICDTKQILMF